MTLHLGDWESQTVDLHDFMPGVMVRGPQNSINSFSNNLFIKNL